MTARPPFVRPPGPAPLGDRSAALRGGTGASFPQETLQQLRDSNRLVAAARARGEVSDAELREEQRKASARADAAPLRRADRRDRQQNPTIFETDLPEKIDFTPDWDFFFAKREELCRRRRKGDPSKKALRAFFDGIRDLQKKSKSNYLRATYKLFAGYAKLSRAWSAEILAYLLGERVLLKLKTLRWESELGENRQAANVYVLCLPEFFEEDPAERAAETPPESIAADDEMTPERHFDPEPPAPRPLSQAPLRRDPPQPTRALAILAKLFGLHARQFGLNVYPLRPRPT